MKYTLYPVYTIVFGYKATTFHRMLSIIIENNAQEICFQSDYVTQNLIRFTRRVSREWKSIRLYKQWT